MSARKFSLAELVRELYAIADEANQEAKKPVPAPLEVAESALFNLLWSRSQSLEKAIAQQSEPIFAIRAQSDALWILERALEIVRQARITGEVLADISEQQEFEPEQPEHPMARAEPRYGPKPAE